MDKFDNNDALILCFPVYFRGVPLIVREFIESVEWRKKKVFIVVTRGMFTGSAVSNAAAMLRSLGATVQGSASFKMPENIGDFPIFQIIMPPSRNRAVIEKADDAVIVLANKIKNKIYPQTGMSAAVTEEKPYEIKMKIDSTKCANCGICRKKCPYGEEFFGERCTLCYRCYANCPEQAITGFGKKVITQYIFGK
jgi:NAD-dependent dihydropyrimidine dehydrogenase PreA subunit